MISGGDRAMVSPVVRIEQAGVEQSRNTSKALAASTRRQFDTAHQTEMLRMSITLGMPLSVCKASAK